jgi:GntR family transcriptional regulator/MocR family aminotransferase
MRARYRLARDAVSDALQRAAGESLRVVVPGQGLHMLAYLRAGLPRDAAARIRSIARIDAWLVSETRLVRSRHDGFVLGFSGQDIRELTAAAHRLGLAVQSYIKDH